MSIAGHVFNFDQCWTVYQWNNFLRIQFKTGGDLIPVSVSVDISVNNAEPLYFRRLIAFFFISFFMDEEIEANVETQEMVLLHTNNEEVKINNPSRPLCLLSCQSQYYTCCFKHYCILSAPKHLSIVLSAAFPSFAVVKLPDVRCVREVEIWQNIGEVEIKMTYTLPELRLWLFDSAEIKGHFKTTTALRSQYILGH